MVEVERECGPLERRCTSCGKVKPRGWFRKAGRRATRSGSVVAFSSTCRECRRESDSKHAAKRRGAGVKRIGRDFLKVLLERQGWVCACGCRRSLWAGYHVDHIVAIARGGKHEESNIQLLSPRCNLRKSSK